jgi:hypothetical protein
VDGQRSESGGAARRWAPGACLTASAVGAVLIIVGLAWKSATSPATFWSPEQAKELQEASDAMHDHTVHGDHEEAGGEHPDHSSAARQRLDRIQAELEQARFARDRVGPLLVTVGLAVAVAFGIGYLVSRGE